MANRRSASVLLRHWRLLAAVLGVVVLANILVHLFVIRKLVSVSGDREAIVANETRRVAAIAEEIRALETTASVVACSRSDVTHVFEDMLSSKQARMTAILRELRKLAVDMRVEPGRLTISRSELEDSGLVRFQVSFAFEAPYATLRRFIEKIEASENFLIIEQVSLVGERGAGSALRLQIRVMTFFMAPDLSRLDATFAGLGRSS